MKVRKIEKGDLETRIKWMNDPRIFQHMGFTPPITYENTLKWFEKNQNQDNRIDLTYLDDDNNIIGFGGITEINWMLRNGEIYIFINPELHGKGLGSKTFNLLLEIGFGKLKLNKLNSHIDASNIGSRKAHEKGGFKLEGILRDEKMLDGKYEDRCYYGILNKEYNPNNVVIEDILIEDYPIKIVRDDLYPQTGGGVKSRKSAFYESLMFKHGYNACVTTGGIQSNHNRAIALMCAKNGWKCHLVYHGSSERYHAEKGNALLVRNSGASYEFVDADGISKAMENAMENLKNKGFNPLYIHGGGHDLPGGIALVEAVKELKEKCDKKGYKPDYIFHASGTGSTQAGIAVGLKLVGWDDVKLIGISVARHKERGTQVIENFANDLAKFYGLEYDFTDKINFNTDYLFGGYEQFSGEMEDFLKVTMKQTGIMFDTTYSGKAFYGMMDYIKKNNINSNILFWHTGGLMNLMK